MLKPNQTQTNPNANRYACRVSNTPCLAERPERRGGAQLPTPGKEEKKADPAAAAVAVRLRVAPVAVTAEPVAWLRLGRFFSGGTLSTLAARGGAEARQGGRAPRRAKDAVKAPRAATLALECESAAVVVPARDRRGASEMVAELTGGFRPVGARAAGARGPT